VPLIEIASLPTQTDTAAVCRRVNAAVAEAIGCRLEAVWSTWRTVDVDVRGDDARTAEADGNAREGPRGPIVHVHHHRTAEQVERIVGAIQLVLARELSIDPDDVFVTTQPVEMADPTLR